MNRTANKPRGHDHNLAGTFKTLLSAAIICFGLFVSAAFAADSARIVSFDVPGSITTYALGITSAGVVVGDYTDTNNVLHGFTYDTSGNFVTLDAPGAGTGSGQGTRPISVSPSGEICGVYIDQYGHDQGFFRNTAGTFTTLNITGEVASPFPTSVNDNAQVVGPYDDSNYQTVGFLWTASGPITSFAPANSTFLEDAFINSSGQIAGYFDTRVKRRGYFRDVNGSITVFDGSPSATGTFVHALNDSASITGFFTDTTGYHGFVRQGRNITEFDVNGSTLTEGEGINNAGTVTGFYADASGVSHGFTRDRLGKVTLFDVAYAGKDANQGTFPTSINAGGQVAGYFLGPLGTYHGFVRR
jgi:hypothetical protein